jgi:hypothetical protein
MAATFNWCEDCGALTSGHGTSRSQSGSAPANCNWKNIDDCTTAYSSSPIVAGNNSFTKYQYGQFSGTYNQVLNGKWSANTNVSTLATGLTLKGVVTATYATPSTTTNAALTTDFTSSVAIGSGSTVLFGADPSTAASSTLSSGGGFSQYLATQLQTTSSAASGDMASIQAVLEYDEN